MEHELFRGPPFVFALSPALIGAPPLRLLNAAQDCVSAGADALHIDVMDGRFAPSITFGTSVIRALKREFGSNILLDVHLSIEDVDTRVEQYIEAGSDIITIPIETSRNPFRLLEAIRQAGRVGGISLLPSTSISVIDELFPVLDLVLVLLTHCGESRLIPSTLQKLEKLSLIRKQQNPNMRVGVDGGVKLDVLPAIMGAGADWVVAASAIFGAGTVMDNIGNFKSACRKSYL